MRCPSAIELAATAGVRCARMFRRPAAALSRRHRAHPCNYWVPVRTCVSPPTPAAAGASSGPDLGTGANTELVVPQPSASQLRIHALHAAVPMIGFGFMDNLVMIQAGDFIDGSLGTMFAFSTLTAAGFGQIFSDIAGVLSGGTVERLAAKINLPTAKLTWDQMNLSITRNYRVFGSVVGVVIGCLLGMTCLLFMDLDKSERLKRQQAMDTIFKFVMDKGKTMMGCERATLYLIDEDKQELWSKYIQETGDIGIIRVPITDKSIVGSVTINKQAQNLQDAYTSSNFNRAYDLKSGFRTKSVLTAPVVNEDGKVLAIIQFINKNQDGKDYFSQSDEQLMDMLCTHVALFINCQEETYSERTLRTQACEGD